MHFIYYHYYYYYLDAPRPFSRVWTHFQSISFSRHYRNSSQETLTSIQSVERSLLSSESLRNSTTSTITANDQKIGEVKNITAFVNGQFRGLQATGEQSLVLINNTISQVNSSLMCFAEAKAIVDNATKVVQSAQRLSTDALLVSSGFSDLLISFFVESC